MPRMGSLLNVIGSSRSRSNGTAGQGTEWCILLAAMQVNYVHTYPEHWSKGFPVFFLFFFLCSGLWWRATWFDLLCLDVLVHM